MSVRISGTGVYLPEKVVTNDYFMNLNNSYYEGLVDYFQGSVERHHASESETALHMAIQSGRRAIEDSGVNPEEIDLLLSYIEISENYMPKDSYVALKELGLKNATVMEYGVCCATFVSMLNLADTLVKSGKYKKILLICSSNWVRHAIDKSKDYRGVGDGAGAAVIEYSEKNSLIAGKDVSFPEFYDFNWLKNSNVSGKSEVLEFTDDNSSGLIALKAVPPVVFDLFKERDLSIDDVDWFICHQPGMKAIEMWCEDLGISMEKNLNTYKQHANMSAPNVPVILHHYIKNEPKIKRGDRILFMMPGSGMHVSIAVWNY